MSASARSHTARLDELCEGRLSPGDVREIALMAFDLLGRTPPEYLDIENPDPGTLLADFDEIAPKLSSLRERVEGEADFDGDGKPDTPYESAMAEALDAIERACGDFDLARSIVEAA